MAKTCCEGCGRDTDNKSGLCGRCHTHGQSQMPSEQKWRPNGKDGKTTGGCAELNSSGFGSFDWERHEGEEEKYQR